jgi:hypothetical protein
MFTFLKYSLLTVQTPVPRIWKYVHICFILQGSLEASEEPSASEETSNAAHSPTTFPTKPYSVRQSHK